MPLRFPFTNHKITTNDAKLGSIGPVALVEQKQIKSHRIGGSGLEPLGIHYPIKFVTSTPCEIAAAARTATSASSSQTCAEAATARPFGYEVKVAATSTLAWASVILVILKASFKHFKPEVLNWQDLKWATTQIAATSFRTGLTRLETGKLDGKTH